MNRARTHRGFSMIEAIACVVTLSIAVPACMFPMRDAAMARVGALQIERAGMLAVAIAQTVRADVASDSPGLGYDALANSSTYLNAAGTGLYARLKPVADVYAAHGFSYQVSVGPPIAASGAATGDPDLDAFRWVMINVRWNSAKGARASLITGQMVCAP